MSPDDPLGIVASSPTIISFGSRHTSNSKGRRLNSFLELERGKLAPRVQNLGKHALSGADLALAGSREWVPLHILALGASPPHLSPSPARQPKASSLGPKC